MESAVEGRRRAVAALRGMREACLQGGSLDTYTFAVADTTGPLLLDTSPAPLRSRRRSPSASAARYPVLCRVVGCLKGSKQSFSAAFPGATGGLAPLGCVGEAPEDKRAAE